jgi:anti-sigma factor RsiW
MGTESHLGERLDAYLDNEVSVDGSLLVQAHLRDCARCRTDAEARLALRAALQRTLRPAPSRQFLARLGRDLRRADGPRRQRQARLAWAGSALAASAALLLVLRPGLPAQESALRGEVVAAHLRSLQAQHLTDVASTDAHTVKPWFAGKLPFGLPVRDFSAAGFPLLGGRLDYLDGRPVAALVYKSRQHAINVLVWPVETGRCSPATRESQAGLNLLHWTCGGMAWWAVSDVNVLDLQTLAAHLQEPEP